MTVWFADVMAHSYFSHQHTTVVHRDDGKEHVHYQMNKAAKEDAPQQKTSSPKTTEDVTVSSFVQSLSRLESFIITTEHSLPVIPLPSAFLSVQIPPPWTAASYNLG